MELSGYLETLRNYHVYDSGDSEVSEDKPITCKIKSFLNSIQTHIAQFESIYTLIQVVLLILIYLEVKKR